MQSRHAHAHHDVDVARDNGACSTMTCVRTYDRDECRPLDVGHLPPPDTCSSEIIIADIYFRTIRYYTRRCFNVCSKADVSQLNLPHGTKN